MIARPGVQRPTAVVIGLDCATGLQTARLLRACNIPVIGVASDRGHPCARTRTVTRVIEANTAGSESIDALVRLGARLDRRAVLFPCTDASVLRVSGDRNRLEQWYHVVLPEHRLVERLADKVLFATLAADLGLPTPVTRVVANRVGLDDAARHVPFPCLMKPARKTPAWDRHAPGKVLRADTGADLVELYERHSGLADQFVIQQWIDGPDTELYTCNGYFDERAEPLTTFVTRKIRQWPPGAGTGCLGEEVRNDEVRDLTVKLFRNARFHGLGYLEVKRDQKSGTYFLIEANVGRPTGRSATAEAAGVPLLHTMYCDALGLPLPTGREQAYRGVKWIYWRKDLGAAVHQWRAGHLTVREWWASVRGPKTCAVSSLTDPLPFLTDVVRAARRSAGQRPVSRVQAVDPNGHEIWHAASTPGATP